MPKKKKQTNPPDPFTIGINLTSTLRCLARCYNAKSSTCRCVCDGKNHGIERERSPQQDMFVTKDIKIRHTTKSEFYKDQLREKSRELDFGVWWRDGANYPTYRVSWIENTGEIYAIDPDDKIEILGIIPNEKRTEEVLIGWANMCGLMNSLQWVRNRIG